MTYVGNFSSESVSSIMVRGDIHCNADFSTMLAVVTIDHKGLVKTGERNHYNAKIEGKDGEILKMDLLLPGKHKVNFNIISKNKDGIVQGNYVSTNPDDKGVFLMRKTSDDRLPPPALSENSSCVVS